MSQATVQDWLREKLASLPPDASIDARRALQQAILEGTNDTCSHTFLNDFVLADLSIFDDDGLHEILAHGLLDGLSTAELGMAMRDAPDDLRDRFARALPASEQNAFWQGIDNGPRDASAAMRRRLLDALFWELTYWKMPEQFEELIEGEPIHAGIFDQLEPELRHKIVADIGAGTGRATHACLLRGVTRVFSVEPSPGLRRILLSRIADGSLDGRVEVREGWFDALGLPDASVDVVLACSAFTLTSDEDGVRKLAQMRQVARTGGLIVIIWPHPQDYRWLAAHGFHYEAVPMSEALVVRFRTPERALALSRRFYAGNPQVERYVREHGSAEVPFSQIGPNPPNDYCWLRVGR